MISEKLEVGRCFLSHRSRRLLKVFKGASTVNSNISIFTPIFTDQTAGSGNAYVVNHFSSFNWSWIVISFDKCFQVEGFELKNTLGPRLPLLCHCTRTTYELCLEESETIGWKATLLVALTV